MKPFITGIGTATPIHSTSQTEALQLFTDIVCETDRQRRLAKALFRKSGVRNRNFVVPHKDAYAWCQLRSPADSSIDRPTNDTLSTSIAVAEPQQSRDVVAGQSAGPTTGERMAMYAHFAADLATESAIAALENSGVAADGITHLVTVTCTGFDSPGVDFALMERLGLSPSTQRINVGFMGCHAAINGLRTALAIAQSDPAARVLVCCIELCSLHYRFQWNSEGVIGNALFADGSASLVIGQQSDSTVDNGWQLVDTGSMVIPDSQSSMSWKVGDHGFEMMLTSEVGDRIEAELSHWLLGWLREHGLELHDIDYWAVHPGGPRILDAVERSLGFSGDELATSRAILSQCGNMSSPTVLFILQQFIQQNSQLNNGLHSKPLESVRRKNCLLLAFGPGLVAEVALLQYQSEKGNYER